MAHHRRFRFGVQLATAPSAQEWARQARRAEELGFSTLFLPDHFGDQLAPLPAMMAAADATSTLRVGSLVLDNDFKHPAVLAKEIATVDVLSGGRVEFGLGAGWMTTDYEQSGIPHDPASIRVDRLEEAVAVCKGLFSEGPFSFEGRHYRIEALDGLPLPAQRPHPPLLLGGGGRRMLSLAAREADIVGINPSLAAGEIGTEAAADAVASATDRKVGWVREAAGDRYDDLELNVLVFMVAVTEDAAGTAELLAATFGIDPAEALEVPHALVGTVEEICERLEQRRDRWDLSYTVVQGDAMEAMAPVIERLHDR
jgi:probable F420-dependent oxidoreductase